MMLIHVVKPNENLWWISRHYNTHIDDILKMNEMQQHSALVPGQSIIVPGITAVHPIMPVESFLSVSPKYQIPIETNAYVQPYEFSDESDTIEKITPLLTYLSPFSYCIQTDGSLIPLADHTLVEEATQSQTACLMVISNCIQGNFNTALVHNILTNPRIYHILIEQILQILRAQKYKGVNIDFEKLYPEDRIPYHQFLQELKTALHEKGYTLSVSLVPKYSNHFTGTWYTAHDYATVGKIADFVMLMTYSWGWAGGPPMPVSPMNQVRMVLDYATSVMPLNKIMLGIALYGYDWTLPYKSHQPAAKTISPKEAVALAKKYHSAIHFDSISQSPYFNYMDELGKQHMVWFEDARSVHAKYELIHRLGLRGVSYWILGRSFPQNWVLLNDMFSIQKNK